MAAKHAHNWVIVGYDYDGKGRVNRIYYRCDCGQTKSENH